MECSILYLCYVETQKETCYNDIPPKQILKTINHYLFY